MHPYLRLRVTLRPHGAAGSRRPPLASPLLRGLLGKALVEAFCPFGRPLCDPKGKGRSTHSGGLDPERRPPGRQTGRTEEAVEPPKGSQPGPLSFSSGDPEQSKGRDTEGKGSPPTPQDLCRLAECCPYGVLFAASLTRRPPFAVFVPGEDGERDEFEITLYGPAWRFYPWVLAALRTALCQTPAAWEIVGIARVHPDRTEERLCDGDLEALPATLGPDLLALTTEPFLASQEVVVEFLSPTFLLSGGKPIPRGKPVGFQILVKSVLDRFQGLYGDGASEILRQEIRSVLEEEAAQVPLLSQEITWGEISHYSARSRAKLDLRGRLGHLIYGGHAAYFFHILRAGEILHLGKNPTFGCGRIRVDLAPGAG